MRLHTPEGAREAYKSGLSAYADDIKRDPTNAVPVIRSASVLVIPLAAPTTRAPLSTKPMPGIPRIAACAILWR